MGASKRAKTTRSLTGYEFPRKAGGTSQPASRLAITILGWLRHPERQGSLRDSAPLRVLARPFGPSLDPPRRATPDRSSSTCEGKPRARERNRTADLRITSALLYRLSYSGLLQKVPGHDIRTAGGANSGFGRRWRSGSQAPEREVTVSIAPVTSGPSALVFDVFGTVVDWRASVISAGEAIGERGGATTDWGRFASEWRREGYLTPIVEMFLGQRSWEPIDHLHEESLGVLLERHGLGGLADGDRQELLSVWRRLAPWPDAVEGLTRLKSRFLIGPLSNGGFALLTEMAKAGGLPWDFIISAELFRAYKPAPEVYQGAARLLERATDEVMLVAAHPPDLDAAKANGMRTAYVPRPLEWGTESPSEPDPDADRFDVVARDFIDLAQKLGV